MKKILTTAILVVMLSSVFAQGRGWDNSNRYGNKHNKGVIQTPHRTATNVQLVCTPVPVRVGGFTQPVISCPPPAVCGPVAMCPADFYQLQQTINRASFESTKFTIFRQALAYNYFTSGQVLDLMNQFCFESYKLDVAQMAYNKTVDPNNYYIVNNGFAFNSSVRQLDDYLAMR